MQGAALLTIRGLSVSYPSARGCIDAVRELDLQVGAGEFLGIVGESGSGKTQLLLSVLGLTGARAQVRGSIRLHDQELLGLPTGALNRVRGDRISMVFQDPMTALNPYLRIGRQISEVLCVHRKLSERAARERAVRMLEAVHIPDPERRLRQYPHELSGGMRQRVMIAIALITEPEIVLADEPSTALDVTVQAQILSLFQELRARTGTAIVLVTHDLGVIAEAVDRVAVMYAGRIVEQAPVLELFAHPRHPYTEALQQSIPRIDAPRPQQLPSIGGAPPDPARLPAGCAFAPRCLYRLPVCETLSPALLEAGADHFKACHYQGALGRLRGAAT
ncbi:MAG TPA: ABC transporter ATP-binding protein [Steroidobacteraceae bacterium]|jgi:oligopeptide/dipeptide ABC transporter ATP-binding protein